MFNNQDSAKMMKEILERLEEEYGCHEADTIQRDNPAVYVGTYGKYNNGDLTGQWVDIASFDDYEEFICYCMALHADEEDPELMFQDYENFPKKWYSESGFDEKVFDRIINYAEQEDREAVDAYLGEFDDDDLRNFEDRFEGKWDSEEDFAWHIIEDCYASELSDWARSYIDVEKFARDLFYDYVYADGYVFRCF